jgi:hypothetical protein
MSCWNSQRNGRNYFLAILVVGHSASVSGLAFLLTIGPAHRYIVTPECWFFKHTSVEEINLNSIPWILRILLSVRRNRKG